MFLVFYLLINIIPFIFGLFSKMDYFQTQYANYTFKKVQF